MAKTNRKSKDSVFTYLFRQPEYARLLYLALHPEDGDVSEADCKIITLENIVTTGQYNDLGMQVRGRLMILIEAQSTFAVNIVLRLLLYLAETYNEYIHDHKLNLYSVTPVQIPRPELYVVYTGNKKNVPDTVNLSELFFEGAGDAEVTVHILRRGKDMDILEQYVQFCKIMDEQRKLYGWSLKTMEETIRICLERNILAPFLRLRKKEVMDIMSVLFDEKLAQELHDQEVRQEGREEGREEGRKEGREEGRKEIISQMANLSMALAEAGRVNELHLALQDPALCQRLLEEFNL